NEEINKQNEQLKIHNDQLMKDREQLKLKDELLVSKNDELTFKDRELRESFIKINSLEYDVKALTSDLSDRTDQISICSTYQMCPKGIRNGIFSIQLPGKDTFETQCTTSGWMTIQKRVDGSENFNRSWTSYKEGFGNANGDFFIGLERLHQLTKSMPHELLIELEDKSGNYTYARYDDFQIGNEEESYYLKSLGNFNGTTLDGLGTNLNMKFSTYDRDNDMLGSNCAKRLNGAWWYNKCGNSSLNGRYYKNGGNVADGIFWPIFVGGKWKNNISYTFVEMMIKPKNS
ncbi:hypothetical protein KR200_005181, partial [Drosophila serrata]